MALFGRRQPHAPLILRGGQNQPPIGKRLVVQSLAAALFPRLPRGKVQIIKGGGRPSVNKVSVTQASPVNTFPRLPRGKVLILTKGPAPSVAKVNVIQSLPASLFPRLPRGKVIIRTGGPAPPIGKLVLEQASRLPVRPLFQPIIHTFLRPAVAVTPPIGKIEILSQAIAAALFPRLPRGKVIRLAQGSPGPIGIVVQRPASRLPPRPLFQPIIHTFLRPPVVVTTPIGKLKILSQAIPAALFPRLPRGKVIRVGPNFLIPGARKPNRPLFSRVPETERVSEDLTLPRRLRRLTDGLVSLLNSLIGQGYIQQTGASSWLSMSGAWTDTRAPGANDDIKAGFAPGNPWVNTATGKIYFCISNGAGAAIWTLLPLPVSATSVTVNRVYLDDYCTGDGTTDDTSGLNTAWNTLPAGGQLIAGPGKHYKFTAPLSWVDKQAVLTMDESTLDWYGSNANTVFAVTAATNATPIVLSVASSGYVQGDIVLVSGVGGNTNANGVYVVSAADATTVTLQESVGNGAYTAGGTVQKFINALTVGWSAGNSAAASTVSQKWKISGLTVRFKADSSSDPNYMQNAVCGLVCQNLYTPDVGASVRGFGIGLQLRGDGTGCTLGRYALDRLKGNIIHQHLFATNTVGTNGYVTANVFLGGDFTWGSEQTTWANQVWQVKSEIGIPGSGNVGECVWVGTIFQGNSGGANVVPRFDLVSGDHWRFNECHFETTTHVAMPMVWETGTFNNRVLGTTGSGAAGDLQIQDKASGGVQNAGFIYDQIWHRIFTATANKSITNTLSESSFVPTGSGFTNLPAYFFARSKRIRVQASGLYSTLGAGPGNMTLKFKLGSIVWTSGSLALPTSASNWSWWMVATLTHRQFGTGSAGRVVGWVRFDLQQGAAGAGTAPLFLPIALTSTAIGDDSAQQIDSTVTFSVADPANIWDCETYDVDAVQ